MCLVGPKYVLRSWPEGYKMFVHYKGPQDNPRTDKYLFGVSPQQTRFTGPHGCFDRRLDARQAFSLCPRVRTPRSMAHDGRKLTKVQLRLQVLHAHTPARYQPSSGLNNPLCFLPRCSDPPVDASTFKSPPTSAPNQIPGLGEGENLWTTFRDGWPSRNVTPSIDPTTARTDHTFEGDTMVRYTQRAEAGEAFHRA